MQPSSTSSPDGPKPRRVSRRSLAIGAAILAFLVLMLGALHTPWVRSAALSWALARWTADLGVRAEVGRLDYDLLNLSGSLHDVTVAAAGSSTPFFQADAIRVDLPWTIGRRGIVIDSLEVRRPRITVVRGADGTSNLPERTDTSSETSIGPIRVGRFLISDLEARYDDRVQDVAVLGHGVSLDMRRDTRGLLTGRVAAPTGLAIRTGTHQTRISRLDGRIAFDGTALALDGLVVDMPEGSLRLDGGVDLLTDRRFKEFRYKGHVDLEQVSPWVSVAPPARGRLTFSGGVEGTLNEPLAVIDLAGERLSWSELDATFRMRVRLSTERAEIDSFTARVAGGEIAGYARVPFDDRSEGQARLDWRNMDAGRLAAAPATRGLARLASTARGAATLQWTGRRVRSGRGSIENILQARTRHGGLAVSGRAELRLDDGNYRLTHEHRLGNAAVLAGSADGRLDVDELPASTLDGRAALRVSDLPGVLRQAREAGLATEVEDLLKLHAVVAADAEIAGTIAAPVARGTVDAKALRYGGTQPGTARARFFASPAAVSVDDLRVTIGPNIIEGAAAIDLETRTLHGRMTANLPRLADLTADVPENWRPDGSASVSARVTGPLGAPAAAVELTSPGLRVAGQTLSSLQSTARLAGGVVTVDRFEVIQNEGRLTGSGRYALGSGRYAAEMAGDELAIVPFKTADLPLDARFDLQLRVSGTLTSPEADGSVDFARLAWHGYELGPAHVTLRTDGGAFHVDGRIPEASAVLRAQIALGAPRAFSADLTVAGANLSRLVRAGGPAGMAIAKNESLLDRAAVTGDVSLSVHTTGHLDKLEDTSAALDLRLDDVTVNGATVRLERPARLRYSSGVIAADDVALSLGETVLSARGRLGDGSDTEALRVALVGSLSDLVPLLRIMPGLETVDASGGIDLKARAAGGLTAPDIDAELSLASARVGRGTLPPLTDVDVRAAFSDGILDLRDARATWQGAKLTASAQAPVALLGDGLPAAYRKTLPDAPGPARATLKIESLTQAALSPFADPAVTAQITGRFDAVATATAPSLALEDVEADVALERAEIELARVPLRQAGSTRLRLAGGRLEVVEWRWAGAGNRIDVTGSALLAAPSPELDLALNGALDLRMLSAFAPAVASSGRATLDVNVTGTADQPSIDGRISLQDGGLIVRDPQIAVTDLQGVVAFARDELQIQNITAQANGGTVRISGAARYPGLELAAGDVSIVGRGMAFELPEHLRSEVDADLRLNLSREAPSLTGTVTVVRGSYREPVSLTAQLLSGVETQTAVPGAGNPGFADRIALGIDVRTVDGIAIDNNYGRLDVTGNLRIVGTVGEPVPTGRLTIEEGGDVYLGGRSYEVVRGTIDFTSGSRIEPTIDLVLETRVRLNDVTLEVAGTPETLEATLRSPGLSQAEVISLLLTGRTADETALTQTAIARSQLLMLLSGEILGFAGRAVGLDTVQIGRGLGGAASDFDLLATDTDPSARLTIGRNLSRDVQLVFSHSLRDTGDVTWLAMYRPVQQLEVRGATLDDGSRSYEFRHELTFGGDARQHARTGERADMSAERVTAVRILGTPGFDDREIRKRLRLKEGDRFDFYRWQQDRDRLESFFRAREFLEVRISARRSRAGDGVALEYDINRGPRTRLTIEGHSLPGDLVDRMEEAWAAAVFDAFLLDDLASMVRAHVTSGGYLRADVKAAVVSEPAAADKEIAVRIVPGPLFRDRRLAFEGQQRFDAVALEAVVEAARLGASMWQDPKALRAAIEQHYRSQGYLETDVNVGTPVFDGEVAILPIRISEGRLFTIADIAVRGAERKPEVELRRAFGVTAASAYIPGDLELARRNVELEYLREGYNDVRVSVAALLDEAHGRVGVVLNVDEGRQHVLADVAITGADTTSRGIVQRVMDLEPGQPASLSDVYRAEKRLYDTGVFRTADIAVVPVEGEGAGTIQPVRASVSLQEYPPYRLRYGVRMNDVIGPAEADREVRPALVIDLLRRNLLGRAIEAGVAGQLEPDRRLARGVVALPRLFGLPVTTSFFLTASHQELASEGAIPFVENLSSVTAEQRFNPSPRMAVTYGYNFSRTHVFEPEPVSILPINFWANVARLTGTYAWDRRDDRFSARDGWFHSSGVEMGTAALGSDLRFIKYLAQQHYYKSLGRGVVLASAFRLGIGHGFDQDLIPSEKFYAGGGTSVRGFAEDGLGEVDFLEAPLGGNGMMLFNQELRFPLFGWARGVAFFDAGNVFPRAADMSLTALAAGTGIGVRIESPFALVRIDFGVPLTNRRREPVGRWYIGLGHAF